MNSTNKTTLQALGYGLAGAAAAAIANQTARRMSPSRSPLNFMGKRAPFRNLFGGGLLSNLLGGGLRRKTTAGGLLSPLIQNFTSGRSNKRELWRTALLGLGAGLGALAAPRHRRGLWGGVGGRRGSGLMTLGRILAGGLVTAAAARMVNKAFRDRNIHDHNVHEPHAHEQRIHDRYNQSL